MLPEGTYPAAVVPVRTKSGPLAIQFGPATANSPLTAAVSFEILRGPQAGRTISAFLYFSEKTVERTIESLRYCGFTGDDLDKFSDQNPDVEVEIVVQHDTYQGKTKAKVQWINAPSRGFVLQETLDTKSMKKFAAQFKVALKAAKPVTGTKAVREEPTKGAADDIDTGFGGGYGGVPDPDPTNGDDDDPPF